MMSQKDANNGMRSTLAQLTAALAFSTLCTSVGMVLSMPTIIIGALRTEEDSPIKLTESEASWFGSLVYVIQPVGSMISAIAQDTLGRKKCLMFINVPMFISWCIIYYSTSARHLLIANVLMGIAIGFMEAPILSYIGEIAQPRLRGILCCFGGVFYNVGLMMECFFGAVMHWRTMVLCSMVGPVAAFIAMALVPDSPAWLVSKGRVREAEKAYQWLRGWVKPEQIKEELDAMVTYVKQTQSAKINKLSDYSPVATAEGVPPAAKVKSKWQIMMEPEVLLSFRMVFIYFIVSACTSLTAMRPFFIEILVDLHLPLDPNLIVAVCGSLQLLGAVSMTVFMKILGKRGLTFLSLGVSVICCLGLTAYIMLGLSMPWLPVIFFGVSYYCASLGLLPIPWILVIELFPLRARGVAGGLCGAFGYLAMFFVIKTYYSLAAMVGVAGVCLLYGGIGILGFVYLYWDMPETEGISLEVIERGLSERRSNRGKHSVNSEHRTIKQHVNTNA